jgi:hypothetical protein
MNTTQFIYNTIKQILTENEDYRGVHTAPNKNDSPMHHLTNTYPDDIYSGYGARYYGDGDTAMDNYSLSVIGSARNKPNKQIKIYRAVPDLNKDIDKEIKQRYDITRYYDQYGFLPLKNALVDKLMEKYSDYTGERYNEGIQNVLKDIFKEINDLNTKKQNKITINDGDWVTINPKYAKDHGIGHLKNRYKILTKTVKASELFTDGNSIHEWGYWK